MDESRDLTTPQARIAWAIARAKKNGTPPERLAEQVGLSRPGLIHWTKPTTDINAVGVGLLMTFCQHAGVNLEWVLQGSGEPEGPYTPSAEVARLARKLAAIEQTEPDEYKALARLINGAFSDETAGKPPRPRPQ